MTQASTLAKTIESPVDVPKALDDAVLSSHLDFCDITGFGNLNWAEIEDSAGKRVHLDGPIDLLSLRGRVRHAGTVTMSDYRVLLAKHTDNGISVVGGKLITGQSAFLELALVPLQTVEDALPISAGTYLGKKTADKAVKDKAWAKAMDLSSTLEKKGTSAHLWESEPAGQPMVGDVVRHRQFGDCSVVKLDDEHISLQKPDGRIVQLGLRILSFAASRTEGGHTLWDVAVKR
ncbi:MAG: hypothetical protein JXX29_16915 [Deltaproteobacteria bacterium]|nr:hypothetical protein [Deltaproteobacteria bacterium]MBN2673368.1 hypothetical protein [Deltaproteobacteria bacterium]